MRKYLVVLPIVCFLVAIAACEKDDICIEGNTPLLVVEFVDVNDTSAVKNVPGLRVIGVGKNTPIATFSDRSSVGTISIPLKTSENSTTFALIANSADDANGAETGNMDTVTFTFDREELFVSRACGFIVNYTNLQATVTTDSDNWIQGIEIIRSTVVNSDSTHVKILH